MLLGSHVTTKMTTLTEDVSNNYQSSVHVGVSDGVTTPREEHRKSCRVMSAIGSLVSKATVCRDEYKVHKKRTLGERERESHRTACPSCILSTGGASFLCMRSHEYQSNGLVLCVSKLLGSHVYQSRDWMSSRSICADAIFVGGGRM